MVDKLTRTDGYMCTQCLTASEEFKVLSTDEQSKVYACMDKAKKDNANIYLTCTREQPKLDF